MAELKTKPTTASITDFLHAVEDEERRKDCYIMPGPARHREHLTPARA